MTQLGAEKRKHYENFIRECQEWDQEMVDLLDFWVRKPMPLHEDIRQMSRLIPMRCAVHQVISALRAELDGKQSQLALMDRYEASLVEYLKHRECWLGEIRTVSVFAKRDKAAA